MKIKIEADLALSVKDTLKAIAEALRQRATLELLEAYPPGEHFKLENQHGAIVITRL